MAQARHRDPKTVKDFVSQVQTPEMLRLLHPRWLRTFALSGRA
jgi:UTP:GlnB (protein PII) uridylyltransferase